MTQANTETSATTPGGGAALRPGRKELDRLAHRLRVPAEGRTPLEIRSPLTGEVIGAVPTGTRQDVEEAVGAARAVQRAWARTSPKERAGILDRYQTLVLDHQDELLDLLQAENGKARGSAFEEVADTVLNCQYYARNVARFLRDKPRRTALPGLVRAWERHVPLGVVGLIAPWNYPLALSIGDGLPALMAGNALVLKPDSQTPFTTIRAFELLEEAGLPRGLVQIVTGPGSVVGEAIIDLTDYVMFTGSTATGRRVASQAAQRLIGCSAELGGKNPMIVAADVDLDRAVRGALAACFSNTGQLCISIERLYVERAIAEEFTARFAEATAALRLGGSQDFGVDVGSLVSQDQLDKITDHVADAEAKGAKAVAGGRARPELGPYFYEPTVLTGVTADMDVYAEETFGPLVSIYPVDSLDEAVDRANDTDYGLNASIYIDDVRRGRRLAERVQAGTVNVNDGYQSAWAATGSPMGGMKASGLGRRHGKEGLLKYTESQTIAVRSALAEKIQVAPEPADTVKRLTALLRSSKHMPF
ncbi:MAG TPA: succinic semialdehyde dehydrogenase [Acidimicrobiales bacterium]|nr:succinic semialdehyde dehydrogenase [Acidimicrobiales bacterium]